MAASTLSKTFVQTTFREATKLEAGAEPGVYTANLRRDWVIGAVPHGGYLTSLMTIASTRYMAEHHSDLDEPHPIFTHLEFPGKSAVGPATITVKPLKLGRRISVLTVSLLQNDQLRLTGFVTHSNISKEEGVTAPVEGWSNLKIPSLEECNVTRGGSDPSIKIRPASAKFDYRYPDGTDGVFGQVGKGVRLQWVKWGPNEGSGENLFIDALGFVSDMFIPLPASHPDVLQNGPGWYPTCNLSLEVKRVPPPGGWRWLFVELRSEVMMNGRMDLRVVVRDENKDIVAIGSQMALILSLERNMGKAKL